MTLPTAFIGHADCSRHDTGWSHPDHQGRLPALTRAVYRDMLTLHDVLLEVEAVPAAEADLFLAHEAQYIARVRTAAAAAGEAGQTLDFGGGQVRVSGASWDAARAAVGAGITAADAIRAGRVRNAFCATRPPGRDAGPSTPGGFSLFNHVAIAARHLRERCGADRVLVVDWGAAPPLGTPTVLRGDPGVRVLAIHAGVPDAGVAGEWDAPLLTGADGAAFGSALTAALERVGDGWTPDWILLSLGLDVLAADPLGTLALTPEDLHPLTATLRQHADDWCSGRLVSLLEGGYAARESGSAVVQHLRALARLPPP